jgi:hypothetical protein
VGGLDVLDELQDVLEARAALRAHLAPLPLPLPLVPAPGVSSGRGGCSGRGMSLSFLPLWVGAPHVFIERAAA